MFGKFLAQLPHTFFMQSVGEHTGCHYILSLVDLLGNFQYFWAHGPYKGPNGGALRGHHFSCLCLQCSGAPLVLFSPHGGSVVEQKLQQKETPLLFVGSTQAWAFWVNSFTCSPSMAKFPYWRVTNSSILENTMKFSSNLNSRLADWSGSMPPFKPVLDKQPLSHSFTYHILTPLINISAMLYEKFKGSSNNRHLSSKQNPSPNYGKMLRSAQHLSTCELLCQHMSKWHWLIYYT